jgi:hypothetical protein
MSWFPVAFRLPAFASRSSDARRGIGPSSRSAYRAKSPDLDGVTAFRTHELRPGVGASSTPRTVVLAPAERSPQPAPAAFQRPVLTPRYQHPSAGPSLRGIDGGSRNSPVRASPRL